jgi:hypothetical protein
MGIYYGRLKRRMSTRIRFNIKIDRKHHSEIKENCKSIEFAVKECCK